MKPPVHANLSPVRIALLGLGTVGSSLADLLNEHREHIYLSTGRSTEICAVLINDTSKDRPGIPETALVTNSMDDLLATEPNIICEAMGGITPTREYLLNALSLGIPVVTANKQLVARAGTELFAQAAKSGTQLRFEASVCGAVPIIRMLRESLSATRVSRVLGILNGTTNYMLTMMSSHGQSYEEALSEAQRLGYAEPDPTEDVEGTDAAAKLAILAGIAFGTTAGLDDIHTRGITQITATDIDYAKKLGYEVKLIARAERTIPSRRQNESSIALCVTPMLIKTHHPLSTIGGSTNAVLVDGSPFGRLVIQGAGAGGPETASALAGDIVSVMGSEPSFLTQDPHVKHIPVTAHELQTERQYVRMRVIDRPGVLATVAGAFSSNEISIEQVIQQRTTNDDEAMLVVTTHPCSLRQLQAALDLVEFKECVAVSILDDQ